MNEMNLMERDRLLARVREEADVIHDPCALGAGLRIGMTGMGLLRRVEAEPSAAGWRIMVELRFTGPECMNYFYFKQNLRRKLLSIQGVAAVEIDFDPSFDWNEDLMTPEARSALQQRRKSVEKLASVQGRG